MFPDSEFLFLSQELLKHEFPHNAGAIRRTDFEANSLNQKNDVKKKLFNKFRREMDVSWLHHSRHIICHGFGDAHQITRHR
jgi:hypothetical protein